MAGKPACVFGMGTCVPPKRIATGNIKLFFFLGDTLCVYATGNIKLFFFLGDTLCVYATRNPLPATWQINSNAIPYFFLP